MRKALGLLAWTSLAAAGLWTTLPGGTARHASADQPTSSTTPVADRGSALSRINPFSRSRSNKTKDNAASYRETAEKLLKEAQALALRGDFAGARQLAERAQSFPVEWGPNERSPEKFLAQLDTRQQLRAQEIATAARPSAKPTSKTNSATTEVAKKPAAPATATEAARVASKAVLPQPSGEPSGDQDQPFAALSANDPARRPIQQIKNEEPTDESDSESIESPIGSAATPKAITSTTPTSAPAAQRLAAAKSLMQQARRALASGDIATARDKAEQAAEIDVAYSVFDERPEQLLAEIDRRANNVGEGAPRTGNLAQSKPAAVPSRPASASPFAASPFEDDEARPVKKPAANTQPPASAVAEAIPFDDDSADQAQTKATAELPPVQNDRQLAQQLLQQAQAAASRGDLEQARSLALEAKELDVTYSLFDLRPEQILAQVDRASNNLTIAKKTKSKAAPKELSDADIPVAQAESGQPKTGRVASPFHPFDDDTSAMGTALAGSKPNAAGRNTSAQQTGDESAKTSVEDPATAKVRQQAMTKLQQARQEMQAGRLEQARQKALEAQQLNATFGLWDDRPEALLEELDRLAEVQQPTPTKRNEPNENKARAMALLKQARADLAAGRISEAHEKATQAAEMNVAFDVFEDRPESVLSAIQRAARHTAGVPPLPEGEPDRPIEKPVPIAKSTSPKSLPEPVAVAADETPTADPVKLETTLEPAPPAEEEMEPANVAVIHPEGPSAEQLFREGQIHLRTGNRAAAYQAFLRASQSGQKLDARRSQQLQDYLRELSPRRKPIQLASGESGPAADAAATDEPRELDPQRPIDIAAERQKVQLDRLRGEVLNAVFRADRLREKDPAKALEILDQAMANIESAPLDKQLTTSLATTLRKTRAEIEAFQKQMEPNLAQAKHNEEVKEAINRERTTRVRIEREFANLVKEFNELMDQRRYAEAEKVAKQAKELNPDNPVAENMVWKSVFARRIESNEKIKSAKEDGFVEALLSVDESSIPFDDRKSLRFPKDWEDITRRRDGKYPADTRIRTPEEQRIESSLNRPISLHFENESLGKVIEHIATVADVNVVLDKAGLEDENLSITSPVSINVDSIQLKNALALLLEPLNMGYTIKNEVLKITSDTRLQGQAVLATYSVADLVVPIQPGQPNLNVFGATPAIGASVGGQLSVGGTGGLQGGQFQVAQPSIAGNAGSSPWLANSNPNWQVSGGGTGHDFRSLIDLIVSTCEPTSWEEVGGAGHIKGNETTLSLVIRQTQRVHDEIRDLLEQLRRLQDLQVTIEVRFVSVSDNFFERIGIDFDFDLQDSLGGPDLFSGGGQQGQAGQGGQGGAQQGQQGGLIPIPPFGSLLPTQQQGQQQQGQQGQQGQQAQQGQAGNFFTPPPQRELTDRDNYGKGGKIVGLGRSESFTQDMDIAFRQGSFGIGVPDFGRFDANAGVNIGFAILSDIETFFFINAAQGDRRNNIMSAPKVTLFNGQTGTVFDGAQRPFVTQLIPVVGAFAVGYQPIITPVFEGVGMSVQAVISADRRYVRLAVTPTFSVIREVQAFTFVSAGGQQGQAGQRGQGGGGQGGFGGGGGQQGFGGIGGGVGMQYGGIYNHGMFGRAMGDRSDFADLAQNGFGGIGGGFGGQGGFGGGQGGFGGGQGGFAGGQGGFQAAGAGEVTVQQPVVAQTLVLTTVAVPDGGTVLLGGVKRLSESRNMAGVPILNKIPYISRLFKNTGVGRETQSLMLMVTPRIVILEEEESLLGIPQ